MINGTLDKRLLSCADFVRAGAVFADIGTDHGYLPLFLLREGRIQRAYLCDVNEEVKAGQPIGLGGNTGRS